MPCLTTTTLYISADFEYTNTGTKTSYYSFGGQRVGYRVDAGATNRLYYLLTDQLGSSSVSYRSDGLATATQRYYPYGQIRSATGPVGNSLTTDRTFTGQTADSASGLIYYGARYFDPATAIFASADTIVPGASAIFLNRYAYVNNNPTNLTDPTGECPDNYCNGAKSKASASGYDQFGNPVGTKDDRCIVTTSCGGQELVDAISHGKAGLGGVVFKIIDAAKQGSLDAADGNWSVDDIDAAIDGRNLEHIIAALGGDVDPQVIAAIVRSVAERLKSHSDLWEQIDQESSLVEDVSGAAVNLAKSALDNSFIRGIMIGAAVGLVCGSTAGIGCGLAAGAVIGGGFGAANYYVNDKPGGLVGNVALGMIQGATVGATRATIGLAVQGSGLMSPLQALNSPPGRIVIAGLITRALS